MQRASCSLDDVFFRRYAFAFSQATPWLGATKISYNTDRCSARATCASSSRACWKEWSWRRSRAMEQTSPSEKRLHLDFSHK